MRAWILDFIISTGLLIGLTLFDIFINFPITCFNQFRKPAEIPKIKNDFLLTPAKVLARKIRRKEIQSVQVIEAFIQRIKEVNPIINGVIEDRFSDAIKDAEKADTFVRSGKLSEEDIEAQFPLLGVPISVKGSIAVKDMLLLSGRKFKDPEKRRSKYDAHAIQQLRKAGAIVLVTSSTPEYCMYLECSNKVIGNTVNPYDTRRIVGASSGGEGGLVSSGCSVVGIGSDIGGSVRLPAHFCGIFGHKPSVFMIDVHGHFPSSKDIEQWEKLLTFGPMVRYASDLSLILNLITKVEKRPLLQLNSKVELKKIKVYYMLSHETIHSHVVEEDIILKMKETIKHLKSVTNSVQEIKINGIQKSSAISTNFIFRVKNIDDIFDNDENRSILFELLKMCFGLSDHNAIPLLLLLVSRSLKKVPFSKDTLDFYDNQLALIRKQFDDILDENAVFICPTLPSTAPFVGQSQSKLSDTGYTSIFNVLGFPVTNCPIGFDSKGLPIGIQIVGNINCDRLTIALAMELEAAFGGWQQRFQ